MYKDLKVVFMGTPSFGFEAFKYLIENTSVVLVVTQPDKPVGRKKVLTPTFIKTVAIENNIPVFQPINIKKEYEEISLCKPDLIITAAYGQIVPKEVLDIPRLGCLNLHGSLLPKYRGAAPIQWAIINGDEKTGVSLMYMDEAMDTGDVIDMLEISIDKEDNFNTLYEKLGYVGKKILEKNLESIVNETNKKEKQDNNLATYTKMIKREDEFINFDRDVLDIVNHINGVYPNGYIKINGEPIKILKADYLEKKVIEHSKIVEINKEELVVSGKNGVISLLVVKPNGKNEMQIKSYLNGVDKNKFKNLKINEV